MILPYNNRRRYTGFEWVLLGFREGEKQNKKGVFDFLQVFSSLPTFFSATV